MDSTRALADTTSKDVASFPTSEHRVSVVKIDRVAVGQVLLEFEPGDRSFTSDWRGAGQVVVLSTTPGPGTTLALYDAPHSGRLRCLARVDGEPNATLTAITQGVSEVYLSAPFGPGFDVALADNHHAVCVATGTGISPVRALIDTLLRRNKNVSLSLHYGVRTTAHVAIAHDLQAWAEAGVHAELSFDEDASKPRTRVQETLFGQSHDWAKTKVYVAGHSGLVTELQQRVQPLGGEVLLNF